MNMNIKMEDILAALEAGESVDDIADTFTNALNSAIKKNEENQKAAAAAKKAKEEKEQKQNAILEVVYAISDLCHLYGQKDLATLLVTEAENDTENIYDSVNNLFSQIDTLKTLFGNDLTKVFATPAPKPAAKTKNSPKESIFKFLETNGLL